ncbi:sulfite exporter TauE/SafE family protein [Diaphorobacter limosus]|uniref:Sulfite exporter TauE/SafE family protein n=1 Tax=Diaphorobacter limosus TaxID=3036128 RepID=A0ABZ0J259_9BURK|nr:sulfite exporter TauE/SafE family protein [Diaphorobacter sp. Y-1]WOO32322.1 sulfite exporter TauE/SafE family protein [Diaphorobacter sp. Y-1]
MLWALASTAFFMGLMGGTHCLVMCAAPCAALTGKGAAPAGDTRVVRLAPQAGTLQRTAGFHLGRLMGYGFAGALAAWAMDRLAWLGQNTAALRPAWTLLHVLILAWGLLMMLQARQPAWLEHAGRSVWTKVRALVARPGGLFVTGMAWALLPCGLLYTALLTAALSGSVLRGALCMVLFGVGSGVWLVAGPILWRSFRARVNRVASSWGSKLAGVVLFAMGGTALWMDVVHGQPAPWCLP